MRKILKVFIMLIILGILLSTFEVKAALQSTPTTNTQQKRDSAENWVSAIRKMEQRNQGMGLEETIGSDLSSTSGSNSIDVHMMKPTEYGAVAILSASTYGRDEKTKAITSTNGNASGVYINQNEWEYTSGGPKEIENNYWGNYTFTYINNKYYNNFGINKATKIGDALSGFDGWHNSGMSVWPNLRFDTMVGFYGLSGSHQGLINQVNNYYNRMSYYIGRIMVARGKEGLFSYSFGGTTFPASTTCPSGGTCVAYARGVAVVGEGI